MIYHLVAAHAFCLVFIFPLLVIPCIMFINIHCAVHNLSFKRPSIFVYSCTIYPTHPCMETYVRIKCFFHLLNAWHRDRTTEWLPENLSHQLLEASCDITLLCWHSLSEWWQLHCYWHWLSMFMYRGMDGHILHW